MFSCQKEKLAYGILLHSTKSMNVAQCNYQICNKKLLAIVHALENWRHYLEGLPEFAVILNYKNLKYWTKAHNFTPSQACCLL